jgi:hypothetical protein
LDTIESDVLLIFTMFDSCSIYEKMWNKNYLA